jgi:hypothetical protein
VLTAVVAAVRRRRAREASRLLWRIAPVVSAIGVAVAMLVRWRHGSPSIPFLLLASAAAVWAVYTFVERRFVRVSDSTAAAIDDDANLGGELRSAAWFANTQGCGDPWAAFHVDRAAERLESIDLAHVYPPVAARRARLATGVLIAAMLIVVAAFPERPRAVAEVRQRARPDIQLGSTHTIVVEGLPPELPQELQDLLAAIESGTLPPAGAANAAMQDMLAKLQSLKDPATLAALARAMANDLKNGDSAAAMKKLAERTRRDAAMTPPSDIRDALENLSKKLSDPDRDLDSAGLEESDEMQQQGSVDMAGAPPQSSHDATAIASLGMVSLSKQDVSDPNAPPGMGAGGTSSAPHGGGTMPEMTQTLRHEIIEANEDDLSSDMQTEARRRTERGQATATFTGAAAAAFDGARASAPPQVPEARRAGMQTYFTRKQ